MLSMNEGYSALHHLQEHFENAAQAHQRPRMKKYKLQLLLLRVVQQRK